MKLHGYWRSSASWRARIALAWKGMPYEYVPVHLLRGEQVAEGYRAKNPMGQVPLLVLDDGRHIAQSMAILEYLEEVHPEPALLPKDPVDRAHARQLAEMINSGIQPLQNIGVQRHVASLGADEKAWTIHWITKGLAALEAVTRHTSGRYCVKDSVSFADVCLVPQLYGARRFSLDMSAYPTLLRIEEACAALPAFKSAHADNQPDANVPA
ncbi:MAG TPA: maleylacetoacetate isomerase [Vulgatibacter sp.]